MISTRPLFHCKRTRHCDKIQPMKHAFIHKLAVAVTLVCLWGFFIPAGGQVYDMRGLWVGKAQGSIFGAEGSVNITVQKDDNIYGVVEGGNFLGRAKFSISGKVRGSYIFGQKEGNTFQGVIYPDGSIRGEVRAIDGDTYQIFLRRPYSQMWGGYYQYNQGR